MEQTIELLSPAGSYEAFRAAVISGCDAVYLGCKDFGARAYAQNFTREELTKAIREAHLLDVKVFLTVNTLFKNSELHDLKKLLADVYKMGIDAFIIQDFGLIGMMKTLFPEAEIHASTQMNCHSPAYAAFLKNQGFSRVVLSRELSLAQIESIHEQVDIELETFVHGALCYCFSGQCLMSSMIGGRSGNRGRCAQPCRLPYQVVIDGDIRAKQYVLSPKDIQTVDLLPDMIRAGVKSYKIEGRMKSPEYVAWNTKVYRHYLDLAAAGNPETLRKVDLEAMLQLYNRGGFSEGYYKQKNGQAMMATKRPNHQGVFVGRVTSVSGKGVHVDFFKPIRHGDALLLGDTTYLCRQNHTNQAVLKMNIKDIKTGMEVYRLKDVDLENRITDLLNSTARTKPVRMLLDMKIGQAARLTLTSGDITVEVAGETVMAATGQGMDRKKLTKPMSKLGNTVFSLEELAIHMDEGVFMPVSQLNELRRNGVEELEKAILSRYTRKHVAIADQKPSDFVAEEADYMSSVSAVISKAYQFEPVFNHGVERIYFETGSYERYMLSSHLQKCKSAGIEAFLALPRILREKDAELLADDLDGLDSLYDGYLVRSMDGYLQRPSEGKKVIFDHTVNILNNEALAFIKAMPDFAGYHPSLELNRREIGDMMLNDAEMLVYGYYQVMTSQQCVLATLEECNPASSAKTVLVDRMNNQLKVERYCRFCQNNIYNPQPMMLMDKKTELISLGLSRFRLRFTDESPDSIKSILDWDMASVTEYTRGHYSRGIL